MKYKTENTAADSQIAFSLTDFDKKFLNLNPENPEQVEAQTKKLVNALPEKIQRDLKKPNVLTAVIKRNAVSNPFDVTSLFKNKIETDCETSTGDDTVIHASYYQEIAKLETQGKAKILNRLTT